MKYRVIRIPENIIVVLMDAGINEELAKLISCKLWEMGIDEAPRVAAFPQEQGNNRQLPIWWVTGK